MDNRRTSLLTVLAVGLAIAGLIAAYVKLELADPEEFADRSVDALRSREVRVVIAEQVTLQVIERGSPDLVASRPLVLAAIEAMLETDEFALIMRRAAANVHGVLLAGDEDALVELEQAGNLLTPAVRSVAPEVAAQIPSELSPEVSEIRRSHAASWVLRAADGAGALAAPLLVLAALAFGLSILLAADRRRAAMRAGIAAVAGALLALVGLVALREEVLSHTGPVGVLSAEDVRAAADASWDALAGDLETWFIVMGVCGIALVAGALLAAARVDREGAARELARILFGGRLPAVGHMLRGLVLAAVGGLILLEADPLFTAATVTLGAALVLLGLAEALSIAERRAPVKPRPKGRRWRLLALAAGSALGAIIAAIVLIGEEGASPPPAGEIEACNGSAALCDRRLDQVVLPGTHNSMSAADRPGWFFANQTRPIPAQLDQGIRLLMLDPHYGVVDSRGRVRTDLRAEGTSRNRVARELGPEAVEVAERLATRLGLVPAEGEREVFLCHTLCELGAERLSSTLDEIRGFLEQEREEVLVLFLESSVDPAEIESAFGSADLEPYLAELRRGRPLPTLREMVASGRRLVVFDQGDGGGEPWYHPGFVFLQDTRNRALSAMSPSGCEPSRGTPESPLLLLNHWIDAFPPSPTQNSEISDRATLLERAERCRALLGRGPNLIAVDFYERTDLLAATRELNRSGSP